jgi:hypothetical protein
MREGISPVKDFDVTDSPDEAELAAQKAEAAKKKKPEAANLMAKVKEGLEKRGLGRGSKPEIKTIRDIPELSDAGMVLDEKKLAEARKKIQLAEGTGEIPLSKEDLLKVTPLAELQEKEKRAEAIKKIGEDIAEEIKNL